MRGILDGCAGAIAYAAKGPVPRPHPAVHEAGARHLSVDQAPGGTTHPSWLGSESFPENLQCGFVGHQKLGWPHISSYGLLTGPRSKTTMLS